MPFSEHTLVTIQTVVQVLAFLAAGGYGIFLLTQEQEQDQQQDQDQHQQQNLNLYLGDRFGEEDVEVEGDEGS